MAERSGQIVGADDVVDVLEHHGRALLVATGSCAVHCRYCFRRHFPYGEEIAAADGWREAQITSQRV